MEDKLELVQLPSKDGIHLTEDQDPLKATTLDDFYKRGYTAIQGLEVDCSADPIREGLSNFHTRVADLRKKQNFATRLIFLGIRIRARTHKKLLVSKKLLEARVRREMARLPDWEGPPEDTSAPSDETVVAATRRVRKVESKKYRVPTDAKRIRAEALLEKELSDLGDLDIAYQEAKAFVEAITTINDNLIKAKEDLLFQMSTIRSQMLVGEVGVASKGEIRRIIGEVLDDLDQDRKTSLATGKRDI